MHIIAVKMLREFWEEPGHGDAEAPLKTWYKEAEHATWGTPAEIKAKYHHASIVSNNRVVFNIAGNTYRLVVAFHYSRGMGFVRFIGTHADYDKIDVTMV